MGIANALYHFAFKKPEAPWEVVDSKSVEPVPLWDDEDDLDIIYIHDTDIVRNYVFDVRAQKDIQRSLIFAQQQMLHEVRSKGYNVLWCEGWDLTLLRKAKRYRVEVRYIGRPAYLSGKPLASPLPPFMGVIDHLARSSCVP
ncbi:hypothetical protein OF83DRAFT_1164985 [Amylostereum chailletii]|nr:hypothetical protein OF83DRAFT_1164985 [Amylostereum chailletii]